jgi:hypothetical protein
VPETSLARRIGTAIPAALPQYLPNLGGHLVQLWHAWPLPLLALSAIGLFRRRGPLASPLAQLAVLPLLAVLANGRFPMLLVPALAVYAAEGAAWFAAALGKRVAAGSPAWAAGLALAGVAIAWAGPPGAHVRHFDEEQIAEMRNAGVWLRENGPPGARVMDRKAYISFFARMRHVQLPDEPYDRIVEHARRSGVHYLALEEYVLLTLRPQLLPLVTDRAFMERERRLRLVYMKRDQPLRGVAIFAVARDSQAVAP